MQVFDVKIAMYAASVMTSMPRWFEVGCFPRLNLQPSVYDQGEPSSWRTSAVDGVFQVCFPKTCYAGIDTFPVKYAGEICGGNWSIAYLRSDTLRAYLDMGLMMMTTTCFWDMIRDNFKSHRKCYFHYSDFKVFNSQGT